jgi:hypothetical protein
MAKTGLLEDNILVYESIEKDFPKDVWTSDESQGGVKSLLIPMHKCTCDLHAVLLRYGCQCGGI